MTRRSWLAILASLPFVGGLASAPALLTCAGENILIPMPPPERTLTLHRFDAEPVKRIMVDLYCPRGHVWAMGGTAVMNVMDGPRDKPNGTHQINGATFACWVA